jgi:hypothetical protein
VFLTYIHISDTPLDSKTVFVSLSLFNILKYSVDDLNFFFRDNLKFFVALKRITTFLNKADIQEGNVERDQKGNISSFEAWIYINS